MPPTPTQHAGFFCYRAPWTFDEWRSEMQPTESAQRQASSAAAPRRSVGCMAGLLRLLSPYHRHRKRLTAKNATPEASPPPPPPPEKKKPAAAQPAAASLAPVVVPAKPKPQTPATGVRRRRSCEAPRSPTIAPEYRRASCDSPRPPPPAIVARLMGLEESAPPSPATVTPRPRPVPTRPPPPPPSPPPEMAAEKRRKLLGALERCDEDLKTLRRIIAAVRAAEMRSVADVGLAPAGAGKEGVNAEWMDGGGEEPSPTPKHEKAARAEVECYPSPDSVLDAITSPRFPCRKRPTPCCTLPDADSKPICAAVGSRIVKPSRTLVFSGDYCKIKQYCNELHAVAMHQPHPPPVASMSVDGIIPRWTPSAAEEESWRHRRRWGLQATGPGSAGRSRAMVESVGEVWGQGAGGERREAGLVGVALERAILQDVVWDVVAELLAQCDRPDAPAPYGHGQGGGGGGTCRKRLCF